MTTPSPQAPDADLRALAEKVQKLRASVRELGELRRQQTRRIFSARHADVSDFNEEKR